MRVLFALLVPAVLNCAVFNFDNLPARTTQDPGTVTPFSDANAGITATFTTPDPLHCFFLDSATGQFPGFFSGNSLYDCRIGVNELDITFSQSVSGVGLLFATLANSPQAFTVSAFSGGVGGLQVGTTTAFPFLTSPVNGSLWGGTISFTGPLFDSVRLTSAAFDWAMDQIDVTPAAQVPEPGTQIVVFVMLALGVLAKYRATGAVCP